MIGAKPKSRKRASKNTQSRYSQSRRKGCIVSKNVVHQRVAAASKQQAIEMHSDADDIDFPSSGKRLNADSNQTVVVQNKPTRGDRREVIVHHVVDEDNEVLDKTVRLHRTAVARLIADNDEAHTRYQRRRSQVMYGVELTPPRDTGSSSAPSFCAQLWDQQFADYDSSFLYSDDGRMRNPVGNSELINGRTVNNNYLSVLVTKDNCADVEYIWKRTFDQFRVTANPR